MKRYETAFGILHKLRAGVFFSVAPDGFFAHIAIRRYSDTLPRAVPQDRAAKAADNKPLSQAENLSRRTFLRASAAAGGGLLLGFALPGPARFAAAAETPSAELFAPNAFIRIGREGAVTLVMPYVEMGQGTYTSIPMLIAEELEIELSQVRLEHAPPNEKLYANPLPHASPGTPRPPPRWPGSTACAHRCAEPR